MPNAFEGTAETALPEARVQQLAMPESNLVPQFQFASLFALSKLKVHRCKPLPYQGRRSKLACSAEILLTKFTCAYRMAGTGDGRASWLTDEHGNTTGQGIGRVQGQQHETDPAFKLEKKPLWLRG